MFDKFYNDYIAAIKNGTIGVETTWKCPLQCPFCARQRDEDKFLISNAKDMPIEDMHKMLSTIHNMNLCGQISDPIYHENFLSVMEVVSQYPDRRFTINTNGTAKKLTWWKSVYELSHSNVKWVFGLDGADQETANIHRVNTKFNDVMKAMILGAKMGKRIEWQFIVFKHNEHQIPNAISIANKYGIKLKLLKSYRWDPIIMKKSGIEQPSPKWVASGEDSEKVFV